ncbi:unnamed protein product [Wickerhamomyces anomalus]
MIMNPSLKQSETPLLKWLKTKPELQNKPELILNAIDEFAKTHRLINIGPSKGSLLAEEISKVEPEVVG